MSVINLTSYFSYNNANKPLAVTLENVMMPDSKSSPDDAVLALYGFRDVLDELSVLRKSVQPGSSFCSVNIEVDVNEIERGQITADNLKDNDFVNVRRVSSDVRNLIADKWNGYLAKEGVDKVHKDEMRTMTFIGRRPDLLTKLHQEPEFSHVSMFVFPVQYDRHLFQRAALFGVDKILSIQAKNNPEITVELPRSLEQKKSIGM